MKMTLRWVDTHGGIVPVLLLKEEKYQGKCHEENTNTQISKYRLLESQT